MKDYLLAIDQGTTNSRAIVFDRSGNLISLHEIPLTQFYPKDGWVEQDPNEIINHSIICCIEALKKAALTVDHIAALGITNQRETTIIWDKKTGKPIYPAIVWQDRRTAALCKDLKQHAMAKIIYKKTGLLLDPYFSATKILWILDYVAMARIRAEAGELLFGTIETYLLWCLTGGKVHVTDASNASRTMLYNLDTQNWDDDLLSFFNIPKLLLPEIKANTAEFGETNANLFGSPVRITAMAGDQHAAMIGQACFAQGMIKMTYGTGGFLMLNTGSQALVSTHQLLTTLAYQIENKYQYALEGSIFSTGTTIKWLRDSIGVIQSAKQTEILAQATQDNSGVYLIPAFSGLGAPYWDTDARGALLGLSHQSGIAEIVRAALESVCFQTKDLLSAIQLDSQMTFNILRADGGMAANNWMLQFLADILNIEVQRPKCIETTALGVAYLAGLQAGLFVSLEEIASLWKMDVSFHPQMSQARRQCSYEGWKDAISRVLCS